MTTSDPTALADIHPDALAAFGPDQVEALERHRAVVTHRRDYWAWVEQYAEPYQRSTLLKLRDHWHAVNGTYFGGRMVEPYITLTTPTAPAVYGQTFAVSSWGSRLEIKLRPSLLDGTHPQVRSGPDHKEGRFRLVADVLMHEAIHQFVMEHCPPYTDSVYRGHGPVFTDHANRIGVALGVPEVVVRRRNRKRKDGTVEEDNRPIASHWPHNVRPREFYLGADEPDPGDAPSRDTEPTTECPCCDGTGRLVLDAPALMRLAIALDEPGFARLADHSLDPSPGAAA